MNAIALFAFITLCLAAAAMGSMFTTPALRPWYAGLRKPSWNPPNWLFAPVWTILYISMGVAAWLVWRKVGLGGRAMQAFATQLILNIAWSAIFLKFKSPGAAFVEIVLLWIAIWAACVEFWTVSAAAMWLLIPYLVWVGFAAALNFSIWRMNK